MDKAGHKMSDVMTGIASLTGKQLSERGRHYSEIFGKFWLSFAVNSSLAALVLWGSDHLQSWQQVAWFGLILNYNIWDPAFQKKMRDGILSSRFMKKYYRFQAVVGSAVEAASYLNVPGFQLLLFSAMSAGVAYSLHHEKFDTVVGPKAHAVKLWVDEKTPVEPEHPLWYKTVMMAKQSCASLLTNTKAKLKSKFKLPRMVRAEPAEDGWWWLPEGNN